MDSLAIATQAVRLVADHLVTPVPESADAAERLHRLVREHLGRTELGGAVLAGFEEDPRDDDRRRMASSALAESARDEHVATELRTAVQAVLARRSEDDPLAGPGSGRAAFVVVAVLLLVVVGAVVTYVVSGGEDAAGTASAQTASAQSFARGDEPGDEHVPVEEIGVDPGEDGARETVEAWWDALVAGDAERACGLLSREVVEKAEATLGGCENYVVEIVNRASEDTAADADGDGAAALEDAEVTDVQITDDSAAVDLSPEADGVTGGEHVRLVREDDRWVLN
ncbi:hypothetical protein [Umezawaea beigongshangensis]|uniref:hypothetical protein n=1 Tax=Umezawaea beigongshangensis TaxID=2780383 RepID=UPI0018F198AF|nr:hypothetical protein [Umezawaea beigongshangensis]